MNETAGMKQQKMKSLMLVQQKLLKKTSNRKSFHGVLLSHFRLHVYQIRKGEQV